MIIFFCSDDVCSSTLQSVQSFQGPFSVVGFGSAADDADAFRVGQMRDQVNQVRERPTHLLALLLWLFIIMIHTYKMRWNGNECACMLVTLCMGSPLMTSCLPDNYPISYEFAPLYVRRFTTPVVRL